MLTHFRQANIRRSLSLSQVKSLFALIHHHDHKFPVSVFAQLLDQERPEVAHHTVVVTLGILTDGRKAVLGLWLGSTENAALLNALLERGLTIEGHILCVIDGGRGIRKALSDVLGDLVMVQRCRVHKKRKLLDHLPPRRPFRA